MSGGQVQKVLLDGVNVADVVLLNFFNNKPMTDKQALSRNVWVLAVENYCKENNITPFQLMGFHSKVKPEMEAVLSSAKEVLKYVKKFPALKK